MKAPSRQPLHILPLITLRDMVIFPYTVKPFVVGRPASLSAVEAAVGDDRRVFLLLQRDPQVEEPRPQGLHGVGVMARLVQSLALPNGHMKLLVEGICRGCVSDFVSDGRTPYVSVRVFEDETAVDAESEDLVAQVARLFDDLNKKVQGQGVAASASSFNQEDPGRFADQVASHLLVTAEQKQGILDALPVPERLGRVRALLAAEVEKISLDQRLNKEVEKHIEKTQKEYYLNEKMKLIKKELGREEGQGEIDELKGRIEKAGMSEAAKEKALGEIKRLELMPPVSAEATVSRTYIDWLLSLPWSKESKDKHDIRRAQKILDEDHFGLEKVKERILEFLSVRQLAKGHKGSILCFSGPPGVGKTSVAKSIARSMGREFVRLSLGGVHDEAEIKGHRRTYIGAFPGQVVQLMKRAGALNPVFLLDEVDKLGSDYRGDPSSALLEVLDPEQNGAFVDHYIDAPFDLSKVFFITTANVTHTIPPALLDRMEVIDFSGYTLPEKLAIANGYLIPKQLKSHGLRKDDMDITPEAIEFLIDGYTREAGVRNLEREVASLCRKVAHQVVKTRKRPHQVIGAKRVESLLGVPRHKERKVLSEDQTGISVGLAWTQHGGDILLIEASLMPGKGDLILTGQMGDVMRESARAALTFLRAHAADYGLDADFARDRDAHIHIPEGSVPKDGPSAGITMAVALASAFTGIPVRHDLAMTGEVTLRGKVLPIGGLKEKILAAKQHDIKEVLVPEDNRKDLAEIPQNLREGMTFHLVDSLAEVILLALAADPLKRPAPILAGAKEPDALQPPRG